MLKRYTNHYLNTTFFHPWTCSIKNAKTSKDLLPLIIARFTEPAKFGPYLTHACDEQPSDILIDLVEAKIIDQNMLAEVVQNGLVAVVENQALTPTSIDLLPENRLKITTGLLRLALFLDLKACRDVILTWTVLNRSFWRSSNQREKEAMKVALWALVNLQTIDPEMEKMWIEIWDNAFRSFWPAAFNGLFIQNIEAAIERVPELIDRKLIETPKLLARLLKTGSGSPNAFADALKMGLVADDRWAGLAMNCIAEGLTVQERNPFLDKLRQINVVVATDLSKELDDSLNFSMD